MAKVSKREYHMRFFVVHLVAYLMVMLFLGAINYQFSPGTLWFIYPAIGWGIGIIMHFLFSVAWNKENREDTRDGWKNNSFMRSFMIHFVVYAMVIGMLLFVNFTYSPDTLWVMFPAIGWGIAVVMHLVFGMLWQQKTE